VRGVTALLASFDSQGSRSTSFVSAVDIEAIDAGASVGPSNYQPGPLSRQKVLAAAPILLSQSSINARLISDGYMFGMDAN